MFGSLGVPELLIIFVILVLLFGVGKLPKLGQGIGEGIRNFRRGIREINTEESEDLGDSAQ
ncbi:MAG: twin-arginine translocase TatA/TatE family subunit [bacterium]|nr:twin-arginine translocase TatA/TatE family subunit [bacterium]